MFDWVDFDTWGFWVPRNSQTVNDNGWHECCPDEFLPEFDEVTLEILIAALEVRPKLNTVRPSGLFENDRPAFFFECAYGYQDFGNGVRDDHTTWFWQAEQGETLGTLLFDLHL